MVGNLINVEGELGLHMSVLRLLVADDRTIFLLEAGELDRDSTIGCKWMPYDVADVV